MTERGAQAVFLKDTCTITHRGSTVLTATKVDNLYRVNSHVLDSSSPSFDGDGAGYAAYSSAPVAPEVWHQRMGHLSYGALSKLTELVDGIKTPAAQFVSKTHDTSVCGHCMAGRMTREPRPEAAQPKSTIKLERIHTDLCGPFSVPAIDEELYYLLAIDEATRYSSITFLKRKGEASAELIAILRRLERRFGAKIKYIRSDNGTEFVTDLLREYCSEHGITHEFTGTYSAESNGLVERYNRTLLERARSMQHQSGLPPEFWAEAVDYANTIRNVSPSAGLAITPFEAMTGTRPDLSRLRVFGSLSYIYIPKEKRKKLDFKTQTGIFLGCDIQSKLSRVWIDGLLSSKRDVRVDESVMGWSRLKPRYDPSDLKSLVEYDPDSIMGVYPEDVIITTPREPRGRRPKRAARQRDVPATDTLDTWSSSDDDESDRDDAVGSISEPGGAPSGASGSPVESSSGEAAGPAGGPGGSSADTHSSHDDDFLDDSDDETSQAARGPAAGGPGGAAAFRSPYLLRSRGNAAVAGGALNAHAAPQEPRTIAEARASPQWPEWQEACRAELEAIHKNGTWDLVPAPSGMKILPSKWVFKVKLAPDGSIARFKARLVVGGHRQVDGVDYAEIFAPVGRYSSLKALLAKSAHEDLELESIDISNAFLNGVLDVPAYMRQPAGFESGNPEHVCKLKKTLYGLKQSPKEWYDVLRKFLLTLDLQPSASDPALWIGAAGMTTPAIYLLHWVDDIIFACESATYLAKIKGAILTKFKGRDLGPVTSYLNMKVERDRRARTLTISQPVHAENILSKFNMTQVKGRAIPMAPSADYSSFIPGDVYLQPSSPYAECVGSLLYMSSVTRPDLSLAVSVLARHMSKPTERHWAQLKGVLRYLSTTRYAGITYGTEGTGTLAAFTDSDYAGCKDTRRSRGGYVFCLFGGAISWSSKLQSVVATSTAEAEYIAAAFAAREAIWCKRICMDLGIGAGGPVDLLADNQAAIFMATNAADSSRTKHIDVAYHFLRSTVARAQLRMVYVSTEENAADMFTKALSLVKLQKFKEMIGMVGLG